MNVVGKLVVTLRKRDRAFRTVPTASSAFVTAQGSGQAVEACPYPAKMGSLSRPAKKPLPNPSVPIAVLPFRCPSCRLCQGRCQVPLIIPAGNEPDRAGGVALFREKFIVSALLLAARMVKNGFAGIRPALKGYTLYIAPSRAILTKSAHLHPFLPQDGPPSLATRPGQPAL